MIKFLKYISVLILFATLSSLKAQSLDSIQYMVRLKNGDAVRGTITKFTDSTITLKTALGEVSIDKNLINKFTLIEGPYTHRPFHYLMPTASPNGPGGFITNYELGFMYAGFGLGYGATISAAMTAIPGLSLNSQLYHLGVKYTIERSNDLEVAIGGTYTFLGDQAMYSHIYSVATIPFYGGRYSFMFHARATGPDEVNLKFQLFNYDTTRVKFYYTSKFGVAMGFDMPLFGRDDMNWVGEIWNGDITKPQNTASMIGVRVQNEHLSAVFGVALIPKPLILPITSFSYKF